MTIRKAFHIAVLALLTWLIADRAILHAQTRDASTLTCAQRADQVRHRALDQGFGDAGASSQGDAAMSRCLVTGRD
jgi:hypothetical protein